MKKILIITHDDLRGGSARSITAQIEYLKKNNLAEPIVITWKKNSLTKHLQKKNLQCYPITFNYTSVWTHHKTLHTIKRPYYRLFYNFTGYKHLKKIISFSEISLIISNSSVIDFGAYLHRKLKIPHIWYLREFGDLDFNILPYIHNLPNYIEQNSSGIIAVSNAVAMHWHNRGIKKNIKVIYNGVINNFEPKPPKKLDSTIKICMCGRLCSAKGQSVAIKSLTFLPKTILEKIHLDFFGNGEHEKYLRNLTKQEKLEKYISFKGFSNNLDNELNNYEIGLMLSNAEAFGRTTVEYMSHSLFVIASKTGGTPELLQNENLGILVEPNNPKEVAEAIKTYHQKREIFQSNLINSQNYAMEKFSTSTNAMLAYKFYEKFMK